MLRKVTQGLGLVVGTSEHSNEHSDSMKREEFSH